MVFETEIEGFITAIQRERFVEIENLRKIFKEMKKDIATNKEYLTCDIDRPDKECLKSNVVAVDGSSYQEQYDSISINIATAYIYSNNEGKEKYLPNIKIVPPYYASLINSVDMKTLEYKIVLDLLKDGIIERPDLILLDGSICFPDEALSNYIENFPLMKKSYDEHKSTVNEFYEFVLKNNIPTVAISKDPTANKYFVSLYKSIKEQSTNDEIDFSESVDSNFLKNVGKNGMYNFISENSFIKKLLHEDSFKRTKYLEITRALRNEIPAEMLRGEICGFYMKSAREQRPFFVEIPSKFIGGIDEITRTLSAFSYYSLRPGYPFPLYAAHKKVELKKKYCRNIATILRNIASKEFKGDHSLIFEEKFHDKL